MSASSFMPQTPQLGTINQLAAVPPLTPPGTEQRTPSLVDTTLSTTAFQENDEIWQTLNKRYQDLRSKEHEIARLQAQLQEQEPTIRRLEDLNAGLQKDNKILVKQENEASERAKGDRAAHTEAEKQCQRLTQDLEDERLKVSAAESSIGTLQKGKQDLKATIASLEEEAEKTRGEKASLAAELAETRTSLTGARQEAQESNNRASFLSNGMSNAEGSLKETEEKLEAAEKKAASWKESEETATALAASEKERADKAESELEGIRRILGVGTGKRPLSPSPDDAEGPEGKRQRLPGPDT